jgi:hypothetical protein
MGCYRERTPSILRNVDGEPRGPCGGSGLYLGSERCVMTCIGMIDKK